jgi:hypothetical protein
MQALISSNLQKQKSRHKWGDYGLILENRIYATVTTLVTAYERSPQESILFAFVNLSDVTDGAHVSIYT